MMAGVTVLRLNVHCPECGAPPKLRTCSEWVDFVKDLEVDPERLVQTYECHIRSCGEVYEIRVKHFHCAA